MNSQNQISNDLSNPQSNLSNNADTTNNNICPQNNSTQNNDSSLKPQANSPSSYKTINSSNTNSNIHTTKQITTTKTKQSNNSKSIHKSNSLAALSIPFPKFESANTLQNSIHNISFTKDERFRQRQGSVNNSAHFYNLPPLNSLRSAGIGFGHRNSLLPLFQTPSPCQYKIPSRLELNMKYHKGITIAQRYSNIDMNKKNKYPGPGAYFKKINWTDKTKGAVLISRKGMYYDEYLKGRGDVNPLTYSVKYSLIDKGRYKNIVIGGMGHAKLDAGTCSPGVGSYNLPSCFDRKMKRSYALN